MLVAAQTPVANRQREPQRIAHRVSIIRDQDEMPSVRHRRNTRDPDQPIHASRPAEDWGKPGLAP
jgi:hypothetical protein